MKWNVNPECARALVRNWCFGKIRTGRSHAKKWLKKLVGREVEVELVPGLRMKLDLGVWQQDFIFWFPEELKPYVQFVAGRAMPGDKQGVFVDCGANTGYLGLWAASQLGCRSLLIEPHPALAERIRMQLALNATRAWTPQVSVHELAASDTEGFAELFLNNRDDGGHALQPDRVLRNKTHHGDAIVTAQVRIGRLGELLESEGIAKVDFLKIDCEGHDEKVVAGLGHMLDPGKISCIYISCSNPLLHKKLTGAGYRGFACRKVYIDQIRRTPEAQLGWTLLKKDPAGTENTKNMMFIDPQILQRIDPSEQPGGSR